MKIEELFAEQVLIGALVLSICAAPWLPELWSHLKDLDTVAGLAGGVVALGLCFLLGIVFDRWADTLTEHLERHHRLRYALGRLALTRDAIPGEVAWQDPFKEDELRLAMLRDSDNVVEWMNYHRSRVRLSRALAVYVPGLTLASEIGVFRLLNSPSNWSALAWLALVIPFAYGLAAFLSVLRPSVPKTYQPTALAYAQKHGFLDQSAASKCQRRTSLLLLCATDPSVMAGGLLLATAILFSCWASSLSLGLIAGGGAIPLL